MMEEAYARGMAVGLPQIDKDTIFFRYRDEQFEFPAYELLGMPGIAHFNGSHYEADVTKLRKLAARMNHG